MNGNKNVCQTTIVLRFYFSSAIQSTTSSVFRLYCCISKQNIFLNNIPTFSTDLENIVTSGSPYIFHIKSYKDHNYKKKRFFRSYFVTNYFQVYLLVTSSLLYTVSDILHRQQLQIDICVCRDVFVPYEICMLLCDNLTYHLN